MNSPHTPDTAGSGDFETTVFDPKRTLGARERAEAQRAEEEIEERFRLQMQETINSICGGDEQRGSGELRNALKKWIGSKKPESLGEAVVLLLAIERSSPYGLHGDALWGYYLGVRDALKGNYSPARLFDACLKNDKKKK